jgi:uncharacterized protein YbjT (DUF2867 family)
MARVLITGGTGGLGSELVPRFAAAGYTVRIMSRRPRPGDGAAYEWAQADLDTGDGVAAALEGADVVVHAASAAQQRRWTADVEQTRVLLEAAKAVGAPHVFYISIVGVDAMSEGRGWPASYYRSKLECERMIEASGVPWSNLRATQFHTLIDVFLRTLDRLPLVLAVPKRFRFQPIDTGEVAERMVQYAADGPSGRLPDLGGPEVLTLGDMARDWLRARGRRKALVNLPLMGTAAAAFGRGLNCAPDHAEGKITWPQWLERTYGAQN